MGKRFDRRAFSVFSGADFFVLFQNHFLKHSHRDHVGRSAFEEAGEADPGRAGSVQQWTVSQCGNAIGFLHLPVRRMQQLPAPKREEHFGVFGMG